MTRKEMRQILDAKNSNVQEEGPEALGPHLEGVKFKIQVSPRTGSFLMVISPGLPGEKTFRISDAMADELGLDSENSTGQAIHIRENPDEFAVYPRSTPFGVQRTVGLKQSRTDCSELV